MQLPRKVKSLELFELARHKSISIAPGPIFSPQRHFENCIRLNYGIAWTPKVEAALATVGAIAGALA